MSMKFCVLMLACLLPSLVQADLDPVTDVRDLSRRLQFLVEVPGSEPARFVYADVGQHLHVFSLEKGKTKAHWDTASLGSPIVHLSVADVDGDGKTEILVATAGGRIHAYSTKDYQLTFENLQRIYFRAITCLTYTNLDDDPALEVAIVADGQLMVFDGATRFLEWSIPDVSGSMILAANVDEDPQMEFVVNSGLIIDTNYRNIEERAVTTGGLGERIVLLDLTGDGYPEVIGENAGFQLKVYDLEHRREIR
jgi:hypothetical protein